jgi:hypothetical protein
MQQPDFEKLLADSLAAHGRSPRTQDTYTLMLRLFGRYLGERFTGRTLETVVPEDIAAYQRYLVTERKVGFSSFNQSTCALRFFYRTCLGKADFEVAPCRTRGSAAACPRSCRPRRRPRSSRPATTSSTRPC